MYIHLNSNWFNSLWGRNLSSASTFSKSESELKLNLPGIGKDNINVSQDGDIITIKVKKSQEEAEYYYTLPFGTKSVKASYTDGVLLLQFEKDDSKVKPITIN